TGQGRGRSAERPGDIPRKGWRDVLLRVKDELSEDNISIVAAGVAFYGLLAIVPALAAMVSIYGLVADPADVQEQLGKLTGFIPGEARQLLDQQLSQITSHSETALGIGVIGGLLLTLWSAAKGMKTLMDALNVVYDEDETRGFVRLNATALLLTLGAIVLAVAAIVLVVALPVLLGNLGLGDTTKTVVSLLTWPVLALLVIIGLAVVYRYGPSRSKPRWQWVSWGAVAATLLWIVASVGFSFYVANFGSYNETYGSMGAVVILLMWFWITAYIVLLGGELNAEMEHQTARDTTDSGGRPMGQRGAYVADTLGESPGNDAAGQPQRDQSDESTQAMPVMTRDVRPENRSGGETPRPGGVTPGQLVDEALRRARQDGDGYLASLGRSVRRHPLPAVLAGVGMVWLLVSDLGRRDRGA
ncbi:MAG: YihY/virulence factor BrkB family protein, partial [Pseudomonadota bacterium]|nr:YihY/virulence factor BrkB family protein [Pseudomonadota bacterium]